MIYFYKPISPQPIENLHNYMHHFFTQLFHGNHAVYTHANFIHADFQDIILTYSEQLDDRLLAVYTVYNTLSQSDKTLVQTIYNNNNDIPGICNNTVGPYKYTQLPLGIQNEIKTLYDSTGVLYKMLTDKKAYKPIKDKCGTLKQHFEEFRKKNEYSVCPFCGMHNLIPKQADDKNEYDHYISKGDYPFCSINFANLVPMCGECNKPRNKGQKDIPYKPGTNPLSQEPIYYPYSNIANHEIRLTILSKDVDLSDVNAWSLIISCNPVMNNDRKDRWIEIFNISDLYKSKITDDNRKWKKWIIEKHYTLCKKGGLNYPFFEDLIKSEFADYCNINNGILMHYYNNFFIADPNCQNNLNGLLAI
jgi:hypothetical protein